MNTKKYFSGEDELLRKCGATPLNRMNAEQLRMLAISQMDEARKAQESANEYTRLAQETLAVWMMKVNEKAGGK